MSIKESWNGRIMRQIIWPKKLTIIRHAQSEQNIVFENLDDNLENLLKKQKEIKDADIPITEFGFHQAEETGLYLANEKEKFDICFTSPYKRTLQTLNKIKSALNYDLKVYKDNRLREKEFGKFHGYSVQEIEKEFPEEYKMGSREGLYWYRPPSGENYPDVELRIHSFLNDLTKNYSNENVLIITHQISYKIFRSIFEHLDENEILNLDDTPNCSIQEYKIDTSNKVQGELKLVKYDKIVW